MPSEKIDLPPMEDELLEHIRWAGDRAAREDLTERIRAYALLAVKQEREQERERCAKLCEANADRWATFAIGPSIAHDCAAAIRQDR